MKQRINIAELLQDCPMGMELDCMMFDDAKFISIEEDDKPICIRTGDIYRYLTKFGTWTFDDNAKCVIFPKGKTTWEGFHRPFKDGDVLAEDSCIFIIQKLGDNGTAAKTYCALHNDGTFDDGTILYFDIDSTKLATEEEKAKLFQAIKDNGYRWNPEFNTLEKLVEPRFKVGDKIRHKITNKNDIYEISKVYDDSYGIVGFTWMIYMKYQDNYELVPKKFDITTLKPFESKVLVRDVNGDNWIGAFYSHYKSELFYVIGNVYYYQCIPYEGNEHLLGTNNDCDDFYKTW